MTTIGELHVGDKITWPNGDSETVVGVDRLGPLVIVDFDNNTSTPPRVATCVINGEVTSGYKSQSARDAQTMQYGADIYWDYLDEHAQQMYDYFTARGDTETADSMFTRSLAESLMGNTGEW